MNNIEKAILQAIIKENRSNFSFLEEHYPYLYVKSREYTNSGIYTNFGYVKRFHSRDINILLSSKETLIADNLQNELSYVVAVTNGEINFLEIVTNGDDQINEETKLNLKTIS
jgi:hypothetical protein